MDQQSKPTLPADVAEKFDLKGITCGAYDVPGFGVIDLTRITAAKAQALVDRGFPYLVAKAAPAPAPPVKVKASASGSTDGNTDAQNL